VVPVVVVFACLLILVIVVITAVKCKMSHDGGRGRMKLTVNHADTLPDPYPEERTFENPIYQVHIA
jgi:hypothetical protein